MQRGTICCSALQCIAVYERVLTHTNEAEELRICVQTYVHVYVCLYIYIYIYVHVCVNLCVHAEEHRKAKGAAT